MKVLILGGTTEAVALATMLHERPGLEVLTSLAGRTRRPAPLPGALRIGGFGGAEGLQQYLADARVDAVVDATHPFASDISRHATQACAVLGLPRLRLNRPRWEAVAGDIWMRVESLPSAAAALTRLTEGADAVVFLACGRKDLAAFTLLTTLRFVVRLIEQPDQPLPLRRYELVVDRGPFIESSERRLLATRRVQVMVTKNSGGDATYAKLAAARALGVTVVMVDRPPAKERPMVADASRACTWVLGLPPMR